GRLVPRRKTGTPRQLADGVLGQPDLVERASDAEFPRRLSARAIVAAIVDVAAVDDHRDAALARERGQPRVELVLAVVAAVGGVGAVLRALELGGRNDEMVEREVAGDATGERAVALRVAGAVGRHAERGGAEDPGCSPSQIRAVDAA